MVYYLQALRIAVITLRLIRLLDSIYNYGLPDVLSFNFVIGLCNYLFLRWYNGLMIFTMYCSIGQSNTYFPWFSLYNLNGNKFLLFDIRLSHCLPRIRWRDRNYTGGNYYLLSHHTIHIYISLFKIILLIPYAS